MTINFVFDENKCFNRFKNEKNIIIWKIPVKIKASKVVESSCKKLLMVIIFHAKSWSVEICHNLIVSRHPWLACYVIIGWWLKGQQVFIETQTNC